MEEQLLGLFALEVVEDETDAAVVVDAVEVDVVGADVADDEVVVLDMANYY